jgi:nucleotide-binding universal stress UspA family protein
MNDNFFDRVLLPISHEEDVKTTSAVAHSYFKDRASELIFVSVIEVTENEPSAPSPEEFEAQADDIFAVIREQFEDAPIPIRTKLRRGVNVVEEIITTATEVDATVIAFVPQPANQLLTLLANHETAAENHYPVIALPRPNATDAAVGPEEQKIADSDRMTVVVPVDGSEPSIEAVRHACAAFPDADITLLHVLKLRKASVYESMTGAPSNDYKQLEKQRQREAKHIFDEARAAVAEFDPTLSTQILTGDVAEMIITYAETVDADQIVMGSSDKRGVRKRFFGSVSKTVTDRSAVPVTVPK